MHVHLPKPLHGWRAFFGEIGVIVVGVLIALAAEQAVEWFHWRSEARDFREALDQEAALNLGNLTFHQMQVKCIARRLGELDKVLAQSADGRPVQLAAKIGIPIEPIGGTSVWESKDAQVVEHLPLDVRLKYAALYDLFRISDGVVNDQYAVWKKLVAYDVAGPLTLEDRRQLAALIDDARGLDSAMRINWPDTLKLGNELGIKPVLWPAMVAMRKHVPDFDICKPILKG